MSATSSAIALADLALVWDQARGDADLAMIDSDLASDAGLETAILLSIILDRRALPDDEPPSGDPTDRRGWWADEFATNEGDLIGSRMWLLARAKETNETALLAKEYITEALQWLLTDSVAASVDVTVAFDGPAGERRLLIGIACTRPDGTPFSFRFDRAWNALTT